MHTVFALLCFVVVIHWLIYPYPSGLLHWHCGNLTIAPVPAKQPWWIWINTSCEFIMNDCITTTKQSTTKPCAYFLGYTVTRAREICFQINLQLHAVDSIYRCKPTSLGNPIVNLRRCYDRLISTAGCLMLVKVQPHLDEWRERVNIVWEPHQRVQKRTCVPVSHRLACSKRASNVLKTTSC